MTRSKPTFTNARFTADGIGGIALTVGSICATLLLGTAIASIRSDSSEAQDAIRGFGKFLQVLGIFETLFLPLLFPKRFVGQSGTFAGECPYCGAPNKLMVHSSTASAGVDCPKCRNRIVLKNGRFYQLDFSNPPDKLFAGISQGIGLVRTGIVVAFFLPIAVVVGVFSGIFTFSLLGFFTPILLCLGISLAMQIRGVWLCWQTPDNTERKQWIIATLWLEAIALALLSLQAVLMGADWLNLPIKGAIFASQLTFLTYLLRLSAFLQRPDLALIFRELRLKNIEIAVGTVAIGLPFAREYEIQILIYLGLFSFVTLLQYLNTLKLLKSHLDKTLTAPS